MNTPPTEFAESKGIVRLIPGVLSIKNNMPFTTHSDLQHKRPYFIVFYANWCGFCKTLSPVMEALAAKYLEMKQHKPVAAIDCDKTPLPASFRNIVQGFPTIYSMRGSVCKKYEGDRTITAFDSHLRQRALEVHDDASSKSDSPKSKSKSKRQKKQKQKQTLEGGKNIFTMLRRRRITKNV